MILRSARTALLLQMMITLLGCTGGGSRETPHWSESTTAQAATTTTPLEAGGADPNIFVKLAKSVVPSVVNISTTKKVRPESGRRAGRPEDLFKRFFDDFLNQRGGRPGTQPDDERDQYDEGDESGVAPNERKGLSQAYSLGTGFLIEEGLILTNNHVIDGADEIKIHFTESEDEQATDGELVGRDTELDLALIRVKSVKKIAPLPLGDSESLQVGEYVIAVGNPFGQGHSVTHGIISAKERKAPDFVLANYLQTDAPINPGNSGGPLVNLRGEVIGISNAIDQRAQGIGFAIPINLVKTVLPQLKSKGTVTRGYIGVLVNEMSPELALKLDLPENTKNPLVAKVYPGEPAQKAGVKEYDVVLEFNGKPIHSAGDLINAVTQVPVGQRGEMRVLRGKKKLTLNIEVMARPSRDEIAENRHGGGKKVPPKKKEKVPTGMDLETLTPAMARELGVPESTQGVLVSDLEYDAPADRSGVQRGDIIVEVDRKKIATIDDFFALVNAKKSYLLRVLRSDGSGREAYAVVVLDLKE